MDEFRTLSISAHNQLPAELHIGMGPPLFPPTLFVEHTSHLAAWWRWGVVMWALCPGGFVTHPPGEVTAAFLTSQACPEVTAATACDRIAGTPDRLELIEQVRRSLSELNPWLDHGDRHATGLAMDAAYGSPKYRQIANPGGRGPNDTPPAGKKKRGRPPAKSRTPGQVKSDIKLFKDWKASGFTRKQFLRKRGIEEAEGIKSIDRGRKHNSTQRNNSGG